MTTEEMHEYLTSLPDATLISAYKGAENDLAQAAAQQPNSDWHQECFAGFVTLGEELRKRGIVLRPLH